jgi:hypothetical protein
MEEGLSVISFNEQKAARLYGMVKDSLTGLVISQADVQFNVSNLNFKTKINGSFKEGFSAPYWDTLVVSKAGYQTQAVPVQLVSGAYDTITIALLPDGFGIQENTHVGLSLFPNPSKNVFSLRLNRQLYNGKVQVRVLNSMGSEVQYEVFENTNEMTVKHSLPGGIYYVQVGFGDEILSIKMIVQ